jgi:FAD/FMN-containing dehydrogenase
MAGRITRRRLLNALATLPLAKVVLPAAAKSAPATSGSPRVRPGDPGWPSDSEWDGLRQEVGGNLLRLHSPFESCASRAVEDCAKLFKALKNPYFLGDDPALTQTLGWVDAWTSRPSVYAVAAKSSADVVAAVNFARAHNLRLVVKGGGHSYLGQSNATDSLLIWTRHMDSVVMHDAFVGDGCAGKVEPKPAASIGAGAIWGRVYNAVTTNGGRYVQGGGCMTVGVAGLISGGGFGSLSKAYGMAAASLLEAEVVTADGAVKIANACSNPDLFWALKGGGGGFGVITRVTLQTHDLPEFFGGFSAEVKATSTAAYRRLVAKIIEFYGQALFNPHWGEQISFHPGFAVAIFMVFQGLSRAEAEGTWRPFFEWVAASPQDFVVTSPPRALAVPARHLWDPAGLRSIPGAVLADDREGASPDNLFWVGNLSETGEVLHAYQSAWLPAALLEPDQQERLVDALVLATKHWRVTLHVNKGLAGAVPDAIAAAKDTAMNPTVVDAFALLITGAHGEPAFPGVPGHEPDVAVAQSQAAAVTKAMNEIRSLLPRVGSYVWETDFFQPEWQDAFWGENYARLRKIKDAYDPDGLFFLHHGVGSEDWSEDGFARVN